MLKFLKRKERNIEKFIRTIKEVDEKDVDARERRLYLDGVMISGIPFTWTSLLDMEEKDFMCVAAGLLRGLISRELNKNGVIRLYKNLGVVFQKILERIGCKGTLIHYENEDVVKIEKEDFERIKKAYEEKKKFF